MANKSYESLTRTEKFRRLLKIAIMTAVLCLAILAPVLRLWDRSIEMRAALNSAKNVLRNTELLYSFYQGSGESFFNTTRQSGLSAAAEAEILNYSSADGEVDLIKWDSYASEVVKMSYREGEFWLFYDRNTDGEGGQWTIYRRMRVYEAN